MSIHIIVTHVDSEPVREGEWPEEDVQIILPPIYGPDGFMEDMPAVMLRARVLEKLWDAGWSRDYISFQVVNDKGEELMAEEGM
jgi:hypothetical protein